MKLNFIVEASCALFCVLGEQHKNNTGKFQTFMFSAVLNCLLEFSRSLTISGLNESRTDFV